MPVYVFKCPTCGHKEDLRRSVEARKLPSRCGQCGSEMDLQPTAPGTILFKGRGFHRNDYPSRAR